MGIGLAAGTLRRQLQETALVGWAVGTAGGAASGGSLGRVGCWRQLQEAVLVGWAAGTQEAACGTLRRQLGYRVGCLHSGGSLGIGWAVYTQEAA